MIVLASIGGTLVAAIVLAAIYDHRAGRHGQHVGPSDAVSRQMGAAAAPYCMQKVSKWPDGPRR
jgi:hypothetical protein